MPRTVGVRATVRDIAAETGLSIATVSRAIHMPEKVANSTRLKVNQAIAITGYTTNAMARSLRLGRSNMILVVAPDIGDPRKLDSGIATMNTATILAR